VLNERHEDEDRLASEPGFLPLMRRAEGAVRRFLGAHMPEASQVYADAMSHALSPDRGALLGHLALRIADRVFTAPRREVAWKGWYGGLGRPRGDPEREDTVQVGAVRVLEMARTFRGVSGASLFTYCRDGVFEAEAKYLRQKGRHGTPVTAARMPGRLDRQEPWEDRADPSEPLAMWSEPFPDPEEALDAAEDEAANAALRALVPREDRARVESHLDGIGVLSPGEVRVILRALPGVQLPHAQRPRTDSERNRLYLARHPEVRAASNVARAERRRRAKAWERAQTAAGVGQGGTGRAA